MHHDCRYYEDDYGPPIYHHPHYIPEYRGPPRTATSMPVYDRSPPRYYGGGGAYPRYQSRHHYSSSAPYHPPLKRPMKHRLGHNPRGAYTSRPPYSGSRGGSFRGTSRGGYYAYERGGGRGGGYSNRGGGPPERGSWRGSRGGYGTQWVASEFGGLFEGVRWVSYVSCCFLLSVPR